MTTMNQPVQLSLYPTFAANRERLQDIDWLEETLSPHCFIRWMGWPRSSRLRMIQFPREFASFLVFMAQQKVRSYLEIGTSSGGAFYTADSYLRAAVADYERAVGYDRTNKIRAFPEYQAAWPRTEFRHQNSRNMTLGTERFDCAFVDARHLEHWVLADFGRVRNNCRLVAFHDIVLKNSGVPKAWAIIKAMGLRSWEFIDTRYPEVCGIGVVEAGGG